MGRRSTAAITAAAAVAALSVILAAADAPRVVFGVGVLRRDGVIIPFGAFDGKKWSNSWPAPEDDLTVPISVRDVPPRWWGPTKPLETWQVWTSPDPQMLRITQLDWIDSHCVRQIVLRSDFRAPTAAPPPIEQPYPKEGLAVSPPLPIERIAIVPPSSDEARLLAPALLESFNKAERIVADAHGHPVSRQGREGRMPEIEAVYAVGEHPRIYYVEASRAYRQLGQRADECAAIAFGTGWFSREGNAVQSLDTGVDLLNCDRAQASYMLPLGAIRIADKFYWLAQFSGWRHERYVIVEIKPKAVEAVLSVWGGSC